LGVVVIILVRLGLIQSLHSFFNFKKGGTLAMVLWYWVFIFMILTVSMYAGFITTGKKFEFLSFLTCFIVLAYSATLLAIILNPVSQALGLINGRVIFLG
jgi:hypothetical protein